MASTPGGGPTGGAEAPGTVAEAGEAAVIGLFAGSSGPARERSADSVHSVGAPCPVVVGNGDDAAVLAGGADVVVTTDLLVEGTHFRADLGSRYDAGRRAVAQNVSDLQAMGAECSHLLVGVVLPAHTPVAEAADLAKGLADEAARHGASVVGGDVTTGPVLVLSVTAIGRLDTGRAPLQMSSARPGDRVVLGGGTGRAAAGLDVLLAGRGGDPRWAALVAAYRCPLVDPGRGAVAAAAGLSALTDVSDGLLRDLGALARASGVSADVHRSALPRDALLEAAACELHGGDGDARVAAEAWQTGGGEDHVLLGTLPTDAPVPTGWTVVGTIGSGEPGAVTVDGSPASAGGWDSMSSAGERRGSSPRTTGPS